MVAPPVRPDDKSAVAEEAAAYWQRPAEGFGQWLSPTANLPGNRRNEPGPASVAGSGRFGQG